LCKSDSLLWRFSWSKVLNWRAQSKQVIALVFENSNSDSVGSETSTPVLDEADTVVAGISPPAFGGDTYMVSCK
jgi:hypothetical protein